MSTFLENLIVLYPNGYNGDGWNMDFLSSNPSITMTFIRDHIDGLMCMNIRRELVLTDWDFTKISKRKDLDYNLIRDYPDKRWSYCSFHR